MLYQSSFHGCPRSDDPSHIRNSRWDVLAWNRAESLITDWEKRPVKDRNALVNHFCNPHMRRILPQWEKDGADMVALFRLHYARYAHLATFPELVERLQHDSEEFRLLWRQHEVQGQRMEPMEFEHPALGHIVLERLTVIVQQEPLLVARVLLPPGETDKQHLLKVMKAAQSVYD